MFLIHGASVNHVATDTVKYVPTDHIGVTDGARTRDTQDHNLVLYQLNYSHHRSTL